MAVEEARGEANTHVHKPLSNHVSKAVYVNRKRIGDFARGIMILGDRLVAPVRDWRNQCVSREESAREAKVNDVISGRTLSASALLDFALEVIASTLRTSRMRNLREQRCRLHQDVH